MLMNRFRPVRVVSICLWLAVPLAAAGQESRHEFTLIEENGVPTALTRGGPKYSEPLFTFEKIHIGEVVLDLTVVQEPLGGLAVTARAQCIDLDILRHCTLPVCGPCPVPVSARRQGPNRDRRLW